MNLEKVVLEKTDTCLTYILKRMGKPPTFCNYESYHEYFDQFTFTRKINSLKKGDVLLWDKETKWEWFPWKIDEKGVEWKNVPIGFHFGIYEGDGYFSDCTRLVIPPHPSLRYRNLKDLKKNPDFILRLNEENNK